MRAVAGMCMIDDGDNICTRKNGREEGDEWWAHMGKIVISIRGSHMVRAMKPLSSNGRWREWHTSKQKLRSWHTCIWKLFYGTCVTSNFFNGMWVNDSNMHGS
jgi:hypothetical protein